MKYITRSVTGITIFSNNNIEDINCSILKYVNNLCITNLSTYEGRTTAIKKIFGYKSLIPIYISEEVFFFQTTSFRDFNIILINYEEVLSISQQGTKTKIIFKDLSKLIVNESYYKISKQIKRIKIIKKYLINHYLL